jgi:hypothetical protein
VNPLSTLSTDGDSEDRMFWQVVLTALGSNAKTARLVAIIVALGLGAAIAHKG